MSGNTFSLHGHFSTAISTWATVIWCCWSVPSAIGQSPTFVASLAAKEVVAGLPFEVVFTLTDAEGQRFTPPTFRDFKPAGPVSESHGVSIVKGKTSTKQSWSYMLESTRAGVFSIGAASVVAGGRQLTTAPLTVKVMSQTASTKGSVGMPPGRDDQVYIIGSLNTQKAFAGQQITWQLKLYTRVAIDGADLISLPDFEGFYSKEKRRFDTRVQYQTIRGKKYAVKTLHEESLFPQTTGELTIGAAQIRVGIDQPGAQGFLFGPKPVTLTTQPVSLSVLPLPEPVPESFTGGVGKYTWEVTADTNALTTDGALTLTVTLKGNGDSRRFAPPKIVVPPTCEIFEPRILEEEEYENESAIVHTKRLEYVVLPKEPGVMEIVPEMTCFDADSNRYYSLTSTPLLFTVTAGTNYHPPNMVDSLPAVPVQTVVQYGLWDKAADFFGTPVFWGGLLLVLMMFGIYWFVKNRKTTTPESRPLPKPRAITVQQRFSHVASLVHGTAPELFYNELLKSLQSYIAARLDLSPAQLNQGVLRAKMAERSITPIRVQAFLSILQTCEQAVFSGYTDAAKMESDWRAAEIVVQELEKEMR